MSVMHKKEVDGLIDDTITKLNTLQGVEAVRLILSVKLKLVEGGNDAWRELSEGGLNYLLPSGDTISDRLDSEMRTLPKNHNLVKLKEDLDLRESEAVVRYRASLTPKKAMKKHEDRFEVLLKELQSFSTRWEVDSDSTVFNYHSFVLELKNDFRKAGQAFFSDLELRSPEEHKASFAEFKRTIERLSLNAERRFKDQEGLWHNYIKPIFKGFLGVVVGVSLALITVGIVPYKAYKHPRIWDAYVDYFFKSETRAVQAAKREWGQFAIKAQLFGNDSGEQGLMKEIDETIEQYQQAPQSKPL